MRKVLWLVLFPMLLMACAPLRQTTSVIKDDINKYVYVYIIPTGPVTSNNGVMVTTPMGLVSSGTQTANPGEIIGGYLMKRGYTILPSIDPELIDNTMVVSYGYLGKREYQPLLYAAGVIVQFRDAKSHSLIASAEAESTGENEADGINKAIIKALNAIFYPSTSSN